MGTWEITLTVTSDAGRKCAHADGVCDGVGVRLFEVLCVGVELGVDVGVGEWDGVDVGECGKPDGVGVGVGLAVGLGRGVCVRDAFIDTTNPLFSRTRTTTATTPTQWDGMLSGSFVIVGNRYVAQPTMTTLPLLL